MENSMKGKTVKPKTFRGQSGYGDGGQLSRSPKPAKRDGKTSGKGFPGAK